MIQLLLRKILSEQAPIKASAVDGETTDRQQPGVRTRHGSEKACFHAHADLSGLPELFGQRHRDALRDLDRARLSTADPDDIRAVAQCGLWERITRKLDALGDRLTPEDRRRIEREIAAEIPCPTKQQYDGWRREGETGWLAKYMNPRVPRWPKP